MRISDWSSALCSSDLSFPLLFRHPREKRGLISRSCNTRNTWEMGSRFRGNDGRVDRENSEIHFRKSLVAPRLACFDARHEDAPPPRASARAVRHLRLRADTAPPLYTRGSVIGTRGQGENLSRPGAPVGVGAASHGNGHALTTPQLLHSRAGLPHGRTDTTGVTR